MTEIPFMEQIIKKLSTANGEGYTASNGITLFLGEDGQVWYLTEGRTPFNMEMIQAAREEFLFGKQESVEDS